MLQKIHMKERCYIIAPSYTGWDIGERSCLNACAHFDEHIVICKGEILAWEDVTQYDEDSRPIEETEECTYREISKEEATKILHENYGGEIPEDVLEELNNV